jgi:predicted acyltransferase
MTYRKLTFPRLVRNFLWSSAASQEQAVITESEKKTSPPLNPSKPRRLLSIDALRGFDMLLIAGGGTFLVRLDGNTGLTWVDWMAAQLEHPAWHGFTFYDFIFPLFLFIAGVSLPFSLNKGMSMGLQKTDIYRKAFRRMLILIALGILYKNAPVPIFEPSEIRLGSVLGRIGIAGFVTTLLYLNFSARGRVFWVAGILLLYYAALFLIPVPGYGAGDLSFEGNLVGWFDRTFLPGRLLQGTYDELGLLTQLPALCLTVMGAFAGDILRSSRQDQQKIVNMLTLGVAGIGLALIWDLHFPINKHLWSSSFILLTGGMAFVFMAAFFWVIDVMQYRKWAFFFKVIGMNSLTVYFAYRFIDFAGTSRLLFGGLYAPLPEVWHGVFNALGALALVWTFLYILYRNKLFLKV